MNNTINSMRFIKGIQALTQKSEKLPFTLGIVKGIKDKGFRIDVEALIKGANAEVIENVPVLKNKYINSPIRENDFVWLCPLSHLIGMYLETKELSQTLTIEEYLAIPGVYKEQFKFSDNEIEMLSDEDEYTLKISKNAGISLISKNGESLVIKSGEYQISGGKAIFEFKNEQTTLKKCIEMILDKLTEELPKCITPGNGAPLTISPTWSASVTLIKSEIAKLLK